MDQYLDITYLKSFNSIPAWFGLGFFQLKLTPTLRIHFWHPDFKAIVNEEEIHDHRYDFKSNILKGSMTNILYNYVENPAGSYTMEYVDCGCEGTPPQLPDIKFDVNVELEQHLIRGDHYSITADEFHRTITNGAITLLERGSVDKRFARLLRKPDNAKICAFSKPMIPDECWEYIQSML